MKDLDEVELSQLLTNLKEANKAGWQIKINDIIKKEPTFYFLYNVDTDRIKEIINGLEVGEYECMIQDITNNEKDKYIYVFGKKLLFTTQDGSSKDLNVHIRVSLVEKEKTILFSMSEAKYMD